MLQTDIDTHVKLTTPSVFVGVKTVKFFDKRFYLLKIRIE